MLKYNVIPRKNPMTKAVKYYGALVSATPVKLSVLADAISKQSTVTIHDVKAVLSSLEEHIVNNLLSGNSVRLGDLGSFRVTLDSAGVEAAADYTAKEIKGIRVRFTPSSNMRYQMSKSNPAVQFLKETEAEEETV